MAHCSHDDDPMKGQLFFLTTDHTFMHIFVYENVQSITYVILRKKTPVLILDRETAVLSSWYVQCLTDQGILHETSICLSQLVENYEQQEKNIRVNRLKLEKINKNHIDTK